MTQVSGNFNANKQVTYLRGCLFPPQLQILNDYYIWEGGKQKSQLERSEIRTTEKIMPQQRFSS